MTNEDYDKQKLDELRHIFAACAMMGMVISGRYGGVPLNDLSAMSFLTAQAMLEERKKYL